jgi:simple sugar transport system ATP-binding protein
VSGLTLPSDHQFGVPLRNIGFEVRAREILGIAGVAGNGQSELMQALIGERLATTPEAIAVDGMAVGTSGPTARRALGISFVPEERLGHAAAPDLALWENAALTAATRLGLTRAGFLDVGQAKAFTAKVIAELGIRTTGPEAAARSVSGGNLQKFVIGREILQTPSVLIAAQPTWGVDAGAAAMIHTLLLSLAKTGTAVLVISQDLDELLAISGRIAVIANGRLSPARPTEELTPRELGLSMGAHAGETVGA